MGRRREGLAVGTLLTVSSLIQLFILPSRFVGADTRKFLEIAAKQRQPGFWAQPEAFDGNYWSVGYPTFLSWVLRLSGDRIVAVQVLQVVMAVALALIAWSLAHRLGVCTRVVVVAAVAFSPGIWWAARNGGYEIVLGLLLCGALALVWAGGAGPVGWGWWRLGGAAVTSGIIMGLAVLVQSKAIIVLPVMLWLLWRWGRLSTGLHLVALLMTLLPWMIRNRLVIGSWSPFNSNASINMWIGNNPDSTTGGFMEPPPFPPGVHGYFEAAAQFAVSQPEAAFSLLLRRMVRLVEPVYLYPDVAIPGPVRVMSHLLTALFTIVLILGFLGFVFGRFWLPARRLPAVGPLAAFVLLFYAVHLPFLAEPRFMSAVLPVTITVAVASLAAMRRSSALVGVAGSELPNRGVDGQASPATEDA